MMAASRSARPSWQDAETPGEVRARARRLPMGRHLLDRSKDNGARRRVPGWLSKQKVPSSGLRRAPQREDRVRPQYGRVKGRRKCGVYWITGCYLEGGHRRVRHANLDQGSELMRNRTLAATCICLLVRDPTLPGSPRGAQRWFDTEAFRNPPDWTFLRIARASIRTRCSDASARPWTRGACNWGCA